MLSRRARVRSLCLFYYTSENGQSQALYNVWTSNGAPWGRRAADCNSINQYAAQPENQNQKKSGSCRIKIPFPPRNEISSMGGMGNAVMSPVARHEWRYKIILRLAPLRQSDYISVGSDTKYASHFSNQTL